MIASSGLDQHRQGAAEFVHATPFVPVGLEHHYTHGWHLAARRSPAPADYLTQFSEGCNRTNSWHSSSDGLAEVFQQRPHLALNALFAEAATAPHPAGALESQPKGQAGQDSAEAPPQGGVCQRHHERVGALPQRLRLTLFLPM